MKKILTLMLLLCCCTAVAMAQMPAAVQRHLPSIIENFNINKSNDKLAYWYAFSDVDGDGINEFSVADYAKEQIYCYKANSDGAQRIRTIPTGTINWQPLFYIYSTEGRNASLDVTLKHRPLFLNDIKIAKNRFSTNNETWTTEGVDVGKMKRTYNRIIFKPHIGNAKFVSEKATGRNGVFTFALTDAAMTRKMFRGYSDYQATPFIVPQAWLNDHTPLNFTRWLNGEKEMSASPDVIQLINGFYGNQHVIATKWLASCPDNERHFYMALFAPKNGVGLVAMVCIAEGMVVSTLDYHGTYYGEGESVWFVDDDGDFMEHAPEIQCLVATDKGLEVYIRQYGGESVQYAILREIGEWLVEIDHQYFIYTFN